MFANRDEVTVWKAVLRYRQWHQVQNSSDRTIQTVKDRMGRFADWYGPEKLLATVTAGDVAAYFRHLQALGLASGTLAGHKSVNKAFWNWCRRQRLVNSNPADILGKREFSYSFRPVHSTAANPRHFEAVIEALPDFANSGRDRDVRDAAMISLAMDSAARRGELHSLRRADIVTALAQNTVTGDGLAVYHARGQGKTGGATIRFYEDTAALLRRWLEAMPAGAAWLWVNLRTGQRLRVDAMDIACVRLCKFAGVPTFRFHAIRKRVVTDVIEATGDAKVGQMLAGHTDPRVTLQYYDDVHQSRVDEMAGRLAAQRRHGEDWGIAELSAAFFGRVAHSSD